MKRYLIMGAAVVVILTTIVILSGKKETSIKNFPSNGTDIVALGDSLVEGVGSSPGHDFVSLLSTKIGKPIINLGRSGDTTGDGLARVAEIDKYQPKVVILLLGGNDFIRRLPIEQTRANLAKLIENLENRGAIVLLLGVRGGLIGHRSDSLFETLRDNYQTAYVRDVLDGLFGHNEFMSDEIHPNDAGYQKIADRIYPVLESLVK